LSDWEYYSDDYYDDDPTLLKNNPQEGSPLQRSKLKISEGLHRGKKRKLAATSDIPELSLDEDPSDDLRAMRPWFQGTIWKSGVPERTEKTLYQPGMGQRVSLLGNWREVFKASQPFGGKRRKSLLRNREPGQEVTGINNRSLQARTRLSHKGNTNGAADELEHEEDEARASRDRKRRRVELEVNPQAPPNHKVVVEIPVRRINGVGKDGQESQMKPAQKPPSSRKRKASDAENENAKEGPFKSPSKRAASGKAPLKTKDRAKPPPLAPGRATRSRKK
jgi:hypothetical protein